jgi:hypothetical protein
MAMVSKQSGEVRESHTIHRDSSHNQLPPTGSPTPKGMIKGGQKMRHLSLSPGSQQAGSLGLQAVTCSKPLEQQ